jgi:predicted NUDIX family NTP pyrophosphohydrolase
VAARSAGVLLFRLGDAGPEVLLVHPGGPLWARRDLGAWSIPKGLCEDGEAPQAAALRELEEELGTVVEVGELLELGSVRQTRGKVVTAWAACGDFDPATIRSMEFEMEWPPRSGRRQRFPEVDRAGWFGPDEARERLLPAQTAFVDRLLALLEERDT